MISVINKTLSKVKTETNIQQLNADRALFRKHVPFGMRSYIASYLIRQMVSRDGRYSFEKRHSGSKMSFDASVSTTLFFNIGKIRRVFYRDIILLILKNTEAKREDIGEIKIYDNYSFVQVSSAVADTIINKLTNLNYRGRILSVSVANERTDRSSIPQVTEELD